MHRDDSAVSPVVGTVLMVAIAIVLSATVWLVAQRFADDGPVDSPKLGVSPDSDDSELAILRAPSGAAQLDWVRDLRLGGTCDPLLNGAAFPLSAGTPVQAGDVLSCQPGDTLTISTSPALGNTLLVQHTFP
jgi:flagellin-like protein